MFIHLRKSVLGKCNELLLSRGADVESYRQQALQCGHDETGLHGVPVAFSLDFLPLLVRNDALRWSRQDNVVTAVKPELCFLTENLEYHSVYPTFDILHLVSEMRKDMLFISFWTTKFCSSLLKFWKKMFGTDQ